MTVFVAKIANLIGWGEVSTKKGKGWTRNKFKLRLDGHNVTIVQHAKVLRMQWHHARGRLIESSTVRVAGIKSMDEGKQFLEDLCALLSFAHHTRVVPYMFKFDNKQSAPSVIGPYNGWRAPFARGRVSRISDFVTQAWPYYRQLKERRALRQLIHLVTVSDAGDSPIAIKVPVTMQCLESIKTYFAIAEGPRFGITEKKDGSFKDAEGCKCEFRKLLDLTLKDVGMSLPTNITKIVRLRDAIVHRGFIRDSDKVTRHIFGAGTTDTFHAMFEIMEEVQDVIREFVFRILKYEGSYLRYSNAGEESNRLLKFGFSQLYPAFETGSVVLVECH